MSTLVLWAAEADENGTAIPNLVPGAGTLFFGWRFTEIEVVKGAVEYLTSLAAKSAKVESF